MPKCLKICFAKAPGGLDLMIRDVGSAYITPGRSCVKELHSRSTNSTATVNERRGGGNRMGTRDARPVAQYRALTSAIGDTHDDEGRVRLIHRTEAPHSWRRLSAAHGAPRHRRIHNSQAS